MSEPFLGEIRIVGFNFAPKGWAFCDGQLLPISQNTALFSLLGTTYGGDGRSTFALPNLQGRAAMHPGRGPGLTSRRLGEQGGVETVTLTQAQMPRHSHSFQFQDGDADQADPAGNALAITDGLPMYTNPGNTVNMASSALPNQGGSQPHNNMQPYLTMNFVIALIGLYPLRS
jgi:microcystin-dependent protein